MITCSCFTAREDRATLRSDPSARAGLREAVCMSMLPFYHCLQETKALNLGIRGRAPGVPVFRDARFQRIYASLTVTVILPWREFLQIPLVTIFIVVIYPVSDNGLNLLIGGTPGNQRGNLILHVTEEAFLRRIVPAVSFPRHRLHERCVP